MKFTAGKLAAIGVSAAMIGILAGPAFGASSVDVLYSSSGGSRTLYLYEPDGTTNLTSTDLSSGTSNFIAKVVDNSYSNNGFKVQATMSNLYGYSNGTYDCNTLVPSSDVTLSSPTGLLEVAGISADLSPVFSISGTLTSANDPLLLTPVPVTGTITGLLPASLTPPLSQSQLTGSTVTNLIGSTLSTLASKLPVSLDTTGLGGNFKFADKHPTCDTGATGASQVPVMTGTADPTGLLGDVQGLVNTALGTATPTLTQLISAGYITSSQVSTLLQGVSGLLNTIGLTGITTDLTSFENTLTATLSGVTSIAQTGSYSSSPDLSINTSNIPAGSYKGVMTVTLVDQ